LIAESEIYYFEGFVLVEQKVFGFEVAMYDSVLMNILNPCDDLLHEEDSFVLIESFLFDDIIE
jgi:hypothetical protein